MHFFILSVQYVIRRVCEIVYIGFARLLFFLKGGYKGYQQEENRWKDFQVDFSLLNPEKRIDGISGFYRVKNEAQLLRTSVEAHLPYLDEIVIVYNDCTDNTPEIARALEMEYPEKIKVYEYKPKVSTLLSMDHVVTPGDSVHSMVNYSNFALSKTTRKIVLKVDADHIPVLPQFVDVVSNVRNSNIGTMLCISGVNIFMKDGSIYVNDRLPFTHIFDVGFFPISKKTKFVHRKNSESLALPIKMYFSRTSLGVLFYHLKGFKPDKGYNNLDLQNRDIQGTAIDKTQNPHLIVWSEAVGKYEQQLKDVAEIKKVLYLDNKFFITK